MGGLQLLKRHLPYHESDHVLNLAYNALLDGQRLEDIELRVVTMKLSWTVWARNGFLIRLPAGISPGVLTKVQFWI